MSSPINLDAIRAVEVQHDPFDFFVVPDAVAQPNIDRIVEAYPDLTLATEEASAANPAFWERCGFTMAAADERYPVMRRALA